VVPTANLPAKFRLIDAVIAVNRGESIRHAAKRNEFDRCYLQRRLDGVPTREEYNKGLQSSSNVQESWLADWATTQGRLGHAPPLLHFKQFAQRVLYNNGIEHTLGVRCNRRFLKRHSEIKNSRTQIVNYKRVNAATAENINIFFDRLDYPEIRAIKYANT
jgi:hypothetical protein